MGTSKAPSLPPRLLGLRRRFERWRQTRKIGSRIPEPLWSAAVKLAEAYGTSATAKVLSIDYNQLKRRLDKGKFASRLQRSAAANNTRFVELPAIGRSGTPECLIELEDVSGAKMRIELKGVAAADLVSLSRGLWDLD